MSPFSLTIEGFSTWVNQFPMTASVLLVVVFLFAGFSLAAIAHRLISGQNASVTPEEIFDLDQLPFPAWTVSENGDFLAANRDLPVPASAPQRMVLVENGVEQHFTTTSSGHDGKTYIFALPCDDLVSLEKTNRRLMETLSTTFTKLPVGLTIFDADKTLTHFNPAVTELLGLEAAWLARRPSIAAVLEKLRENRHLPDHKDFLEWRRLLVNLQSTSKSNSYSDVWTLPNGSSLQVTGQAHSEGAVTFLFEDITAQIAVERRHFAETALNQAVVDQILDPMVVINPAGSIISANKAFEELFNFQDTNAVCDATISSLAHDFPVADEFWSRLQNFVSQSINREGWTLPICLDAARTADVHPMPDGSTLVFLRLKWVSPQIVPIESPAISVTGS